MTPEQPANLDLFAIAMEMKRFPAPQSACVDFFGMSVHDVGSLIEELGTLRIKVERLRYMDSLEIQIRKLRAELDTVTAERDLFRKECVALVNDCIAAPDRLSAQEGGGGMTAPRITAEELDSMLHHISRFDPPCQAEFNGRTMRDVLLDLREARSELDRLSAQGGEVPKEVVPADLWAIHWSPGCWDLHESREEAEAVARSGICELVPLWSSPAHPHPDTVEVSRAVLEHLVSLREPKAGEEEGELLDVLSHALRAHAQPATEREGT